MNEQVELLRIKLEELVSVTDSLVDSEVVSLSQELDNHICKYYSNYNERAELFHKLMSE